MAKKTMIQHHHSSFIMVLLIVMHSWLLMAEAAETDRKSVGLQTVNVTLPTNEDFLDEPTGGEEKIRQAGFSADDVFNSLDRHKIPNADGRSQVPHLFQSNKDTKKKHKHHVSGRKKNKIAAWPAVQKYITMNKPAPVLPKTMNNSTGHHHLSGQSNGTKKGQIDVSKQASEISQQVQLWQAGSQLETTGSKPYYSPMMPNTTTNKTDYSGELSRQVNALNNGSITNDISSGVSNYETKLKPTNFTDGSNAMTSPHHQQQVMSSMPTKVRDGVLKSNAFCQDRVRLYVSINGSVSSFRPAGCPSTNAVRKQKVYDTSVAKPKPPVKPAVKTHPKPSGSSKSTRRRHRGSTRRKSSHHRRSLSPYRAYKIQLMKTIISRFQTTQHKRVSKRFQLFDWTFWTSARKFLCAMKKNPPTFINAADSSSPYGKGKLATYLPKSNKEFHMPRSKHCAIVSSAGSILDSGIGHKIDATEQVVRLNMAEVGSRFHKDVGSKTTVRMLNDFSISKLPASGDPFGVHPVEDPYSLNATLLGWDLCDNRYGRVQLHKCYEGLASGKPSRVDGSPHNALGAYLNWKESGRDRRQLYILDPLWLFKLVDIMQQFSPYHLYSTSTPSTGFIAFAAMLHSCDWLHLYHMIPPMTPSHAPHWYYKSSRMRWRENSTTAGTSLYNYHQRYMEVALYMMLNEAPDADVFSRKGHTLIRGVTNLACR